MSVASIVMGVPRKGNIPCGVALHSCVCDSVLHSTIIHSGKFLVYAHILHVYMCLYLMKMQHISAG